MGDPLSAFLIEAEMETSKSSAIVASDEKVEKDQFDESSGTVEDSSCNLPDFGDLLIAGCNDWDGMTGSKPTGWEMPYLISLKAPVKRVFSSSSSCHLFITLATGELYSFGKNSNGQLGLGDKITRSYPTHIKLESGSEVVKLSTGKSHSLLIFADGELWGCGSNQYGQLGLGEGAKAMVDVVNFKKIPNAVHVRDVACGSEYSLYCTLDGFLYAFGHPEYGQLGFGNNGQYIKEGKRGIQFSFVTRPQQVKLFCTKDNRGKLTGEIPAMSVKIRAVSAGKNHSLCLEEWEGESANRIFTWGFGGYGRNGHNSADDEMTPRELTFFSRPSPMQQARSIIAGATYSCATTESGHFYFWGKLPNSPRGEAILYPKIQQELYDWNIRCVGAGSSFVVVASKDVCIGWGVPVAGKLGLEQDVRSSVVPKYVDRVKFLRTIDISCGYGHCCFVVDSTQNELARDALTNFPVLSPPKLNEGLSSMKHAPSNKEKCSSKKQKKN